MGEIDELRQLGSLCPCEDFMLTSNFTTDQTVGEVWTSDQRWRASRTAHILLSNKGARDTITKLLT